MHQAKASGRAKHYDTPVVKPPLFSIFEYLTGTRLILVWRAFVS